MLRWRAAIKAGYGTVARMDDETTPEDRVKLLAVCWLDGVGEEWQRVAVEVFNASLRIAMSNGAQLESSDFMDACDMEYFKHLNHAKETATPDIDWAAAEAQLRQALRV